MASSDHTDYRRRAEEIYRQDQLEHAGRAGTSHEGPAAHGDPPDLTHLNEELQIHQIELELQLEDAKAAREEAEAAREEFSRLFHFSPVPLLVVDPGGEIQLMNQSAEKYLNLEGLHLPGRNIASGFSPEDGSRILMALKSRAAGTGGGAGYYAVKPEGVEAPERFAEIEIGDWQRSPEGALLVAIIDVTDRKLREDQQAEEIQRHRRLLKEMNHRVKNNLQILSSIVELERRRVGGDGALASISARIRNVARAHTSLHEATSTVEKANLNRLLESTVSQFSALLAEHLSAEFHRAEEELVLPSQRALNISLVVNELMTNAIQHAYPDGRPGKVWVVLSKPGPATIRVIVADDGVGMDTSHPTESGGIGRTLCMQLISDLGGTWEMESRGDGFEGLRHTIEVPLE